MKQQSSTPTVDNMYGEYKVCRTWLSMEDFYNLYPDVTERELKQLAERLENETAHSH